MPSPNAARSDVEPLCRALGVTATFADLLIERGLADVDRARAFLDPRLADLTSPDAMIDRDVAADRLASATKKGERVVVFGDYDVDGITSCAILTIALRTLGAEVVPILASRFDGGYGVSARAVERILEARPTLVVTCDCGSSDHDRLATLKAAGLDVIVIDHHLVPDEALPALAFLNPHRPDCRFPFKHLASCGLALSIVAAVRTRLGVAFDLKPLLDLVALGTVADVAPLLGDNRALVRAGLQRMVTAPRVGLEALLRTTGGVSAGVLGAEDVSFRLAPRINAPGRLGAPDASLALLLETDAVRAEALAISLDASSKNRREIERGIVVEAIAQVVATKQGTAPAIVVAGEGWHLGVVGIVAARLVDKYRVPVVAIALDGASGRGSARGPQGVRLHDALTASKPALVGFGGHQAAAGVHVRSVDVARLRDLFASAIASHARDAAEAGMPSVGAKRYDVALRHGDPLDALVRDLDRFEPSGEGNRAPSLLVADAEVVRTRVMGQEHLRLVVRHGARTIDAFGFNLAANSPRIGARVDLIGAPRRDTYRGGDAVELRISSVEPSR